MKNLKEITSITIILFIIVIFFLPLFYPFSQIFVTPDFGQSDIFQLNLPAKYSLSQALKNNELPLWNNNIGTGFPQLAEGQIGTFNIMNLFLFKFLPFPFSYNFGYILIFLTSALGTYFYGKKIGFSKIVSLYISVIFSFSGFFITHLQHYNLIQTASFLPISFLLFSYITGKKYLLPILILSLVLSQQFFSGFPQVSFITIIGLLLLLTFYLLKKIVNLKKYILIVILISFSIIILSAAQFFPSLELLQTSDRNRGLSLQNATYFSYPIRHLITLINPFALGNPKDGSYPYFIDFDGSVFWENTGYMGVIPIFLFLLTLFVPKKNKLILFYWCMVGISLLLTLGKFSPFALIYSIPPFSFFRVPSRFILLFVWSVVILSGFGLSHLLKYKFVKNIKNIYTGILLTILLVSFYDIFSFGSKYNPVEEAKSWIEPPPITKNLPSNRYLTLGMPESWNLIFLKNGWKKDTNDYKYFLNYLQPNQNLLYNLPSFQTYPALLTNRYGLANKLLSENIVSKDSNLDINTGGYNQLRINNIGNVISSQKINNLNLVKEILPSNSKVPSIKLFNIPTNNRATIRHQYKIAKNIKDYTDILTSKSFDPQKEVILENNPSFKNAQKSKIESDIKWIKDTNTELIFETQTKNNGIFVLADSYYPGWKAFIDNKETKIFPANINQRAVELPKGNHVVKFSYSPLRIKISFITTIVGYIIIIFLLGYLIHSVTFLKHHKIS